MIADFLQNIKHLLRRELNIHSLDILLSTLSYYQIWLFCAFRSALIHELVENN